MNNFSQFYYSNLRNDDKHFIIPFLFSMPDYQFLPEHLEKGFPVVLGTPHFQVASFIAFELEHDCISHAHFKPGMCNLASMASVETFRNP